MQRGNCWCHVSASKALSSSPFVKVYLARWKTAEVWGRGGGPRGSTSPLTPPGPPPSLHLPPVSAVSLRRRRTGSHDRKDPDSLRSQCGNVSTQEGEEIIRGGRNHREEDQGEGGTSCNRTIKGGRCGTAPSPRCSCSTGWGETPLFRPGLSIQWRIMAPFRTIESPGHPAYTFLSIMTTLSRFPHKSPVLVCLISPSAECGLCRCLWPCAPRVVVILAARCSKVQAQTPHRGFGGGPSVASGICSLGKYVKMIDAVNAEGLLRRAKRIQGQVEAVRTELQRFGSCH